MMTYVTKFFLYGLALFTSLDVLSRHPRSQEDTPIHEERS